MSKMLGQKILLRFPMVCLTPVPSGEITVFTGPKQNIGTRKSNFWRNIFDIFQKPKVVEQKNAVPGFAACTFQDDRRKKENVIVCSALILDIDNKESATT